MNTVLRALDLGWAPSGSWPWWLGALGLAAVAIGYSFALGRPFGVSTAVGRVLDPSSATRREPWLPQLVFLASIALGGALAALAAGRFGVTSYGALYESLLGAGPLGLGALFVGGLLVGFGTQLSGGCTSGHGLVGSARLTGPSVAATACFFGTAVVVSSLLSWWAR